MINDKIRHKNSQEINIKIKLKLNSSLKDNYEYCIIKWMAKNSLMVHI